MKRKRTSYARGSGRVEGIPNERKYRLCYIEKTLDRTYLTVDAVMKKELLECRNKTGRLNLTSRSRLVKLDHLSQQKFQNVLRLDELERRRQVKRQKIEADIERERLKKEAFNLRFQQATGQLENTARMRSVKRDVARVRTVLTQKAALAAAE